MYPRYSIQWFGLPKVGREPVLCTVEWPHPMAPSEHLGYISIF